jgi:LexA DNA binding domain-containing protein
MFIADPPLSRTTMNRAADSRRDFTPRQGQYLAFIHAYTLVNGRPAAEADMIRFFQVTPPTVHQMVLSLEKAGLISRKPGVPRSIAVLLERSALPELNPADALQAQKFLACPSSCSAWPPLSKAGGTIMKRRLIML